ncbi:MAG: thiamine phosphate synthase [Betaproteobacteria bacterium]|nr:thiamine phosphate synthase [Betaproteobacteria bacterium]
MTHIKRDTPSGLYAITPESFSFTELMLWAEALTRHSVKWFQYRRKQLSNAMKQQEARALQSYLSERGAHLIVNDDVELALEINAYGVHLGTQDLSLNELNTRYSTHTLMVGASCYQDLDLAMKAQELGADYVAFGSVFPSSTKAHAAIAPLHLFDQDRTLRSITKVAIGGITVNNAKAVIHAGADAIAVVGALANLETLNETVQQFQQLIIESRMHHEHHQ